MFPKMKDKHEAIALFTPEDFLDYLKRQDKYPEKEIPKSAILCFSDTVIENIKERYEVGKIDFYDEFYTFAETNHKVGIVGGFGIGSPAVATVMEELIELGTKKFLIFGLAGSLDDDLNVGDLVLCDKAIRDEGTSYHYLKPSKYSYPSDKLMKEIEAKLKENNLEYVKGTTWTIDTPYREAKQEIEQHKEEGVKTVEMESSAVFAVAKYKDVKAAALFAVSDIVGKERWEPEFEKAKKELEDALPAIIEVMND